MGILSVAAVVAATSACTSSGGSSTAAVGRCEAHLIYFGAQTGPNANLGISIYRGAKLAVDTYNKKNPSCKVTLEASDTQGDEKQAATLAPKVVQKSAILGMIGPAFSGESEASDPVFNSAGLPLITASATNPTLAAKHWKVFHRMLGNDADQGPAAAEFLKSVDKATKVFVVDDTTAYGKGVADQVRGHLGSLVTSNDTVQPKQTDFQATVGKVKNSGADAVFYGGYYAEAGPFVKQLRDAGVTAKVVAPDGVKDPGFVAGAGKAAADGTVVTCPCIPGDEAKGSFYTDYQAEFHSQPGTYGPEAYDSANVFLDGIKAGKLTRKDMLSFVNSYDRDGVTKHIKFSPNGEIAKSEIVIWAYKITNGEIVKDQKIPTSG